MRILQIVHSFPPESIAGTETYCEVLSRRLLERGHECMVLAGCGRSAPEATLATVDQDGLLVTRYLRTEGHPCRWTEEYDPEAEGLTRRLLTLVQPDLVHLHHWQRLTNNLVAICAESRIPVVVTLHDVWTSCPRIHRIRWDGEFCAEPIATAPCLTCAERGPWQGDREIDGALTMRQEMMRMELALANAIVAPSEAHRAFLLKLIDLSPDRLTVIPHGSIPTVRPRQSPGGQPGFPNRPLQIGHWGYLIPLKGTHLILEAVHTLRDPSAVQVHLIGTTVEREYEERLRELARDIPVQFHGAYRPADLQAFDLDIAVFASITSESYSFALDEALHLGLPVLVSDRGALPERIGAAGRAFRAGDAGDLARHLQEILDAPEALDTMRRSVRPETLFSMEDHVAMLEKTYKDAAHTRRPKRKSSTPYLKLLAHARQQVSEREEALAGLQRQATLAQARAQEQEAERAAEAEAHRAAEAVRAELEAERARLHAELARVAEELAAAVALTPEHEAERARLHAELSRLAQEREAEAQARLLVEQHLEELSRRLLSLEDAHRVRVEELEQAVAALTGDRESLMRRLVEIERTPAARLQALLARLARPGQ